MGGLGSERGLMGLVLASAALVLAAPVVGRAGHERAADLCMAVAAGAGLLSFAVAALYTFRAARRRAPGRQGRASQ
jgi:hypothetical protein